ncbi:MAG: Ig-like domain-containing protein, partial [Candidatus Sulfotelmatobacter sp.]
SLNPSIYGQPVAWTATVTTAGPFPTTGTVNFIWSGNTIGTATLNATGVATLTRSNLNADSYPLTAVYTGDSNNLGSTSSIVNQVVTQATSSATLSSSPNPSTLGEAVTFAAKITSPTVTAKGPVTFTAGKTVLGTAQLSGGKATLRTSSLAAGPSLVTVTYQGDSNIRGSSDSVTQTVQ